MAVKGEGYKEMRTRELGGGNWEEEDDVRRNMKRRTTSEFSVVSSFTPVTKLKMVRIRNHIRICKSNS